MERFAIREGSQEQGDITLNIFIVSDVSIELRAVSVFNDTLLLPDEGQQEIGRQATRKRPEAFLLYTIKLIYVMRLWGASMINLTL